MKLLSTYHSDDQMRNAWVFFDEDKEEYVVELLDNIVHKENRYYFSNEIVAVEFAEEWVQ